MLKTEIKFRDTVRVKDDNNNNNKKYFFLETYYYSLFLKCFGPFPDKGHSKIDCRQDW